MDINTKKLKKNAFRVSKVRGIAASRVRVPGGCCNAEVMQQVVDIAKKYGNGQIHLTTRQGFEIEGIRMEDMDKVNEMLQPIIENLEINQTEPGTGYPASGTRNVCACIGNRVCPFGNYNTAAFAKRIEKAIFPNDLHFKVALTGCANDCIKARMHDFGIIGMTEPQYDPNRCVSCGACVKGCDKLSVDALKMENYRVVRNEEKCVGCGVCVTKCPTRAWTRSEKISDRKVCLMTYCRNDRCPTLKDCSGYDFFIKCPQIFDGTAASSDNDHIHICCIKPLDSFDNTLSCTCTLYKSRI